MLESITAKRNENTVKGPGLRSGKASNNRSMVILISSTIDEQDQMLFISTDEGASFQRQPLSFTVETLLFHPSDEDKLLAYSKEAT
ncbi:VPS10 domain-containing receptor SorCS2, partial [Tachysurus ichikawai]